MPEMLIEIAELPVVVRTASAEFAGMLQNRYGEFAAMGSAGGKGITLDVELVPPSYFRREDADKEVSVRFRGGRWIIERGYFQAEWDPAGGTAQLRQSLNPYGIDAVLRVIHSLILAGDHGFLLHSASAIRNGRAFLFAGVSGSGKTTISRLAPADTLLLTDEISYVRRAAVVDADSGQKRPGESYEAFGTPFAGELARLGEKIHAPLAAVYLLAQAPQNCIQRISQAEAVRSLMRNVLFFVQEGELMPKIFQTVLHLVTTVPVYRLEFLPDARVWDLIA